MPVKQPPLFSWWLILLFSGIALGCLFLLFPRHLLLSQMKNGNNASPLTVEYLKDLVIRYPENMDYKISLVQQEVAMNHFSAAQRMITHYLELPLTEKARWKLQLIQYQIIRTRTFALRAHSVARSAQEQILEQWLFVLKNAPYLTAKEAAFLGHDALALNLPQLALGFYKQVLHSKQTMPASFYAQAGKAALFVSDYQTSADFYLMAMQRYQSKAQKKKSFINAINSLSAGGLPGQALELAQKHINSVPQDKDLLLFLVNTALRGNQPKTAEEYMTQIIRLQFTQ